MLTFISGNNPFGVAGGGSRCAGRAFDSAHRLYMADAVDGERDLDGRGDAEDITRFELERFAMIKFLATLLASAALSTALPLQARAELDVVSLKSAIESSVESDYPKLDALYKDIHAHPEIAFQEEKTAAKLAAEMRALGFEVTEHVGKTGLVAIYKNGDGPTIMVRTELDALHD